MTTADKDCFGPNGTVPVVVDKVSGTPVAVDKRYARFRQRTECLSVRRSMLIQFTFACHCFPSHCFPSHCAMNPRLIALMTFLFVAPLVGVLAVNCEQLAEDMEPDPRNGYMIYVTTNT